MIDAGRLDDPASGRRERAGARGKTGFRDDPVLEPGIPNLLVNLRYSDGSLYKSTLTDAVGNFSFSEYFPWWRFLVPEVTADGPSGKQPTGKEIQAIIVGRTLCLRLIRVQHTCATPGI